MPETRAGVVVVAVTGGIGSGKSSLCRLLRARPGAVHVDADRVVRGLLAGNRELARAIAARIGPEVLAVGGRIDRGRLAARVFADRRALARLEALVHPLVLERLARRVAALKRRHDVAIVVVEIPLLAEVGVPAWCDVVVTVEADRARRLERLAARGLSEAAARRRMARQTGDARRRRMADYVIRNDAGLAELERGAGELWRRLVSPVRRAGRGGRGRAGQGGRSREREGR